MKRMRIKEEAAASIRCPKTTATVTLTTNEAAAVGGLGQT
jgi:hypothetical protein